MTDAYELFEQILSSGPSSETLLILISKFKEEKDWEKVIEACSKALLQFPTNIHLRLLLVEALFQERFLSQAQVEAEEVVKNLDSLTPVYKLLAKIYLQQEKQGPAFNILKHYLFFRPNDPEAQDLLQNLAFEKEEKETPQPVVKQPAHEMEGLPLQTDVVAAAEHAPGPMETPAPSEEKESRVVAAEEKIGMSEWIDKNDVRMEKMEPPAEPEAEESLSLETPEENRMSEPWEGKAPLKFEFAEEPRSETPPEPKEEDLALEQAEEEQEAAPESLATEAVAPAEPPASVPAEAAPDDDFYYFTACEAEEPDSLPEIATPTLAEIYFNQGLLEDAIHTYEKIVKNNPRDQRATNRLTQIKTAAPTVVQDKKKAKTLAKKKKEKLISVLDNWLEKIRQIS